MAFGVFDWGQRMLLPPPPASPVPLPRKRERNDGGTILPQRILSRLRGRGTSRRLVEGGATSTSLAYYYVQIPIRGSFVVLRS